MQGYCLILAAFLAHPAFAAVTMDSSPTLETLKKEGQKDPASLPKNADAKKQASTTFTGEKDDKGFDIVTLKPVEYLDLKGKPKDPPSPPPDDGNPQPPTPPKPSSPPAKTDGPTYHFEGNSPLPGVTIYTPKKDVTGDEKTDKPPKPKSQGLISPTLIYGALGLGLVAAVIGALYFAPLLFVAGAALGIGGVLWFINKKFGG